MKPSDAIAERLEELRSQYGITRIGLFGSFARAEQDSSSDIDVLVAFAEPVDLFTFLALQEHLEALVGRKVDLVTEKALKPCMRDKVLEEVTYL